MGCDIHIYTERLFQENKWINCDHWIINPYWEKDSNEEPEFNCEHIYNGRNYRLFSILADVRNDNSQYNEPIHQPKGLPKNCSNIIRQKSESWGADGHSHSYLTLRELREYKKNHHMIKYSGMMTEACAKMIDCGEMPTSWCKWTSIEGYTYREWEHENTIMDSLIDALEKRMKEVFKYQIDNNVSDFENKIRIVFWFDN